MLATYAPRPSNAATFHAAHKVQIQLLHTAYLRSNAPTTVSYRSAYRTNPNPNFMGHRYTQTSQFIYTHPHSTRSKRCLRELVVGSNSPNPSHAHSGVPFHGVGPTRSLHHSILLIQYHFISMHFQFSVFTHGYFRTTNRKIAVPRRK